MRSLLAASSCAFVLLLTSCNTSIGLWRDSKEGYRWTKDRIQNSGSGGGSEEYDYGAPVY